MWGPWGGRVVREGEVWGDGGVVGWVVDGEEDGR